LKIKDGKRNQTIRWKELQTSNIEKDGGMNMEFSSIHLRIK
jgi:hypothetical protein